MGGNDGQLKKVRTFQSDMARLKPGAAAVPDMPAALAVKLPPVMTPAPKQPAAIPAAIATPVSEHLTSAEAAPLAPVAPLNRAPAEKKFIPAAEAPTAVQVDVSKRLQEVRTSGPAAEPEHLDIMDSDSAVAVGSIITDQKRDRFKLLPAMGEAIRGWFAEGREAIEDRAEEKRRAVPTVRTIEERKDVVQKAAQQSALAPKDDYKKLQAKLPGNLPKQAEEEPSVIIKKKDPKKKPAWSHFTGLEEKPTAAAIETPAPQAAAVAPAAAPILPPPPQRTPAADSKIEPVSFTIAPKPMPDIPAREAKTVAPVPVSRPTASSFSPRLAAIGRYLRYALIILVALSAAGGGVFLSVWFLSQPAAEEPDVPSAPATAPETNPSSVSGSVMVSLPLSGSRTDLYQAIRQTAGTSGLTVVALTIGGREAGTAAVLAALDWQASPPLLRAVDHVTFGIYQSSAFVILKVASFDAAFGGMLAAEEHLGEDLSPLFRTAADMAVASSSAESSAEAADVPRFLDDIVANHDVRIWYRPDGQEGIVYGFANQNTIIIAEDRETFAAVAPLIR